VDVVARIDEEADEFGRRRRMNWWASAREVSEGTERCRANGAEGTDAEQRFSPGEKL
jgi:hypothetical protein